MLFNLLYVSYGIVHAHIITHAIPNRLEDHAKHCKNVESTQGGDSGEHNMAAALGQFLSHF